MTVYHLVTDVKLHQGGLRVTCFVNDHVIHLQQMVTFIENSKLIGTCEFQNNLCVSGQSSVRSHQLFVVAFFFTEKLSQTT